jgi:hypothetical protein
MRVRIRIPGLAGAALQALERKARLFLGRHASAIELVEVTRMEESDASIHHAECEVAVTLRDGERIRVHDDGSHVHRALLRAAWRIDQRRELKRLREGAASPSARSGL